MPPCFFKSFKKMKVKTITIKNFKGIHSLEINAEGNNVDIFGANGTGKSSVADAINWLFFDKDTTDAKQFGIRPIGCEKEADTVVTMVTDKHTMTKVCHEKWSKPKGQADYVFGGLETSGEWDGIPCKITELRNKIAEELGASEEVIRLCTRPDAFFKLKWDAKRQILSSMVNVKSNEELADTEDLKAFVSEVTGINLADFKKKVNKQKKEVKDEIATIPSKIEELGNLKKTVNPNIEAELAEADKAVESLNKALEEQNGTSNALEEQNALQAKINALNDSLFTAKRKADELVASKQSRITSLEGQIEGLERRIKSKEEAVEERKVIKNNLIESYKECYKNAVLHKEDLFCPTCGQLMPESKRLEAEKAFNEQKAKKLKEIEEKGHSNNRSIVTITQEIDKHKAELADAREELERVKGESTPISVNTESIEAEISSLRKQMGEIKVVDNSELIARLKEANAHRDELRKMAGADNFNQDLDKRIEELHKKNAELGKQLVALEKGEYLALTLEQKRMNDVEEQVNSLFSSIKFRMFDTTIDGNPVETCVATIDGVDYSDANTASKVNAGIEVINVLSKHYGIEVPVVIDNRESVTRLIECSQQLFNLFVDESQKTLIVKS